MNFNCTLFVNILVVLVLVFIKISFSQECDSSGFSCISCTDYQKCSAGSSERAIISCKSGESCADVQLKQCQVKLNCYALNECTQAGIFPDVMVDSNYYVCLDDASSGFLKFEFSCPEGNFFDQSSLTCVPRSVSSSTSDNPTSIITTVSPSSPEVSTDTTLSSSTTDLTSSSLVTDPSTPNTSTNTTLSSDTTEPTFPTTSPSIPTNPSTSSTSTDITSPSISTNPPSSTTVPSTPTPFICTTPGIFLNPDNCKMYYRCSTSLKAFFYICPGNSYFNENISKCSLIITPTCQEQILRNSSSVPPPITTPATTITATITTIKTTPKPTTVTTPSTTTPTIISTTTPLISTFTTISPSFTVSTQATTTTTTNSPLTTPMSCTTAGLFANPLDCKTYYRCSLSGKIFRYVCPGNTYFNEITQRCSLIITARCKSLI